MEPTELDPNIGEYDCFQIKDGMIFRGRVFMNFFEPPFVATLRPAERRAPGWSFWPAGLHGEFLAELHRLSWIDDDNALTDRGREALAELADGNDGQLVRIYPLGDDSPTP